jgi:hypothetical protein
MSSKDVGPNPQEIQALGPESLAHQGDNIGLFAAVLDVRLPQSWSEDGDDARAFPEFVTRQSAIGPPT